MNDYWDGKHIHFCTYSEQSAQDVSVSCGIRLSTWMAPGKKSAKGPEDLGYSFDTLPVNCPKCIEWMKSNLGRCKTCSAIAQYNFCSDCVEDELDKKRWK